MSDREQLIKTLVYKASMTLDLSEGIDYVITLTSFGEEGLPGLASIIEDPTVNDSVIEVAQYAIKRINQGLVWRF